MLPPTSGSLRAVLQHEVASALNKHDMFCSNDSSILHQIWLQSFQHMLHCFEEGERERESVCERETER